MMLWIYLYRLKTILLGMANDLGDLLQAGLNVGFIKLDSII